MADTPDAAVDVHPRARPGYRRARARSNAAASIRRSDHAVADRPARPHGSLRSRKPSRASGPSSRSRRRFLPTSRPKQRRSRRVVRCRPPACGPPIGSTRATCRSSRSIHRIPWTSTRRTTPNDAANGYRVHYAIADVAAFVAPGSALDRESFVRGVTQYLPDGRAPMLPNQLGQGAASLLPDEERPALLWSIDLDATGATTSARLERATVRSRARLDVPERPGRDRPRRRRRATRPAARDRRASTRSRSRTRWHQPRSPHRRR